MGRVEQKRRTRALRVALAEKLYKSGSLIFDKVPRTDGSPKKNAEKDFAFYNRSSRPEMSRIRDFIEDCASNFPDSEIKEMVSRLRSGDDVHFRSATFELFLHEALRRQGFALTPHPELPNRNPHKPDFLVSDPNGESFYLEAVLATENNELDKGGEARKGDVLDVLAAAPHKNFIIAIDDDGSPKTPPSAKKLKNSVHVWLGSLDPDVVDQEITNSGLDSIEPLSWHHDGWSLQIRPLPLNPECRGKSSGLIGAGLTGGGYVDAWSPIRDAIKFKGGKYGDLDAPLVVAVNLDSFHLDSIDEMQALYGQEQVVVSPGRGDNPQMRRAPNGAWFGKSGPQYTRVSAAWLFNDLHASSLATRDSTIYFNPWASSPAPESLKRFPFALPEENKMRWFEGLSFREIFGLHEGWPREA